MHAIDKGSNSRNLNSGLKIWTKNKKLLQEDVLELNALLSRWPVLPAERALQLLDYAYPDEHVRKFAVK